VELFLFVFGALGAKVLDDYADFTHVEGGGMWLCAGPGSIQARRDGDWGLGEETATVGAKANRAWGRESWVAKLKRSVESVSVAIPVSVVDGQSKAAAGEDVCGVRHFRGNPTVEAMLTGADYDLVPKEFALENRIRDGGGYRQL
jgi:hypothetical protein